MQRLSQGGGMRGGKDALWGERADLYWSARAEVQAKYPGKHLRLPSQSQTKYWEFIANFMKQEASGLSSRDALKAAAKAYAEKLAQEASEKKLTVVSDTMEEQHHSGGVHGSVEETTSQSPSPQSQDATIAVSESTVSESGGNQA